MHNSQDIHHIQRDIIVSLAGRSPQRFSELQPARIPNNTFSYHLKRLVELGYVKPGAQSGYIVTRKALKLIQYRGEVDTRPAAPALITILHVTNDQGEVLILSRAKRPFVDYFGLPSGLIHAGETVDEAAQRELFEKTGIVPSVAPTYAGVLDFQYLEEESKDIFVHAVAFLYTYHQGNTPLPPTNGTYGRLSWSGLTREKILPEVQRIHELVSLRPTLTSVSFDEPR